MTPEQAKQALLEQGITQTELARKLGVDRQDVTDVLNGRVKGHFGAAHKVAKHLGIRIEPRAQYGSRSRAGDKRAEA